MIGEAVQYFFADSIGKEGTAPPSLCGLNICRERSFGLGGYPFPLILQIIFGKSEVVDLGDNIRKVHTVAPDLDQLTCLKDPP